MPQAIGAMMQLLLQRETAFRTRPTPAAAFRLPFTKYNMGRDPQKVRDPSISSSPLPGKSGLGDAIVQGSIESILDLRSIGHPGLITHPPPFRCQIDSRFDTGQGIEQLFDP